MRRRTLADGLRGVFHVLTCAAALAGCLPDDAPRGLRRTPDGTGPRVVFQLEARPLPEIPFPNDLATRPDETSPTGRRLNLSLEAPTEAERELRALALELDGFGTFAPLSVRFDRPLDLERLDGRGRAPAEDPVLLLDLTPGATFAARIPLDLGRGNFPVRLPTLNAYFDHDPRAEASNLLFETVEEDTDRDGELDPGEDTDGDGVLDHPNVFGARADDETESPDDDGLVTFYEAETDTLVLRPVVPMRGAHTYAVVLTEGIVGRDGEPIRSPFDWVNHLRQSEALSTLPEALAKHGHTVDEVAFAWTFTTQSATETMQQLSQGLSGRGPFAALRTRFPPVLKAIDPMRDEGEPDRFFLGGAKLQQSFAIIAPAFVGGGPEVIAAFMESYRGVALLVGGRFVSPYLLGDDDGEGAPGQPGYPGDDDEHFRLDANTGELVVEGREVPFWCVVPKPRPGLTAPFPVVLFAHGFGGTRLHSLGVAGTLARWGFATCAIDAVGHGMPIRGDFRGQLDAVLGVLKMRPFAGILEGWRARDLNNDGIPDSAGDTFTTDALHTRDILRQSALDWLQFHQILRGFDGRTKWSIPGAAGALAGDFDGDGRVDLGGPDVDYHFSGISYGGLMTGLVGGLAPGLRSTVPIAGGGGLTDIALRSTQAGVPEATILRAMGPIVVGEPSEDDEEGEEGEEGTRLRFLLTDATAMKSVTFGAWPALAPGEVVRLTNLRTGESADGLVGAGGAFRVAVATDALSGTELRVREGLEPWRPDFEPKPLKSTEGVGDALLLQAFRLGEVLPRLTFDTIGEDFAFNGVIHPAGAPLVAPLQGWGLLRQTPKMRRFVQITQTLLEPADPVNYARFHAREPVDGGEGANVLSIVTLGDTNVPVATGLAFARAAGLVDEVENARLISAGVVEGLSRLAPLVDPDNLSEGQDTFDNPRLDPPVRATHPRTPTGGTLALRIPVIEPAGAHGFGWPRPDRAWDAETYLANLMGQFFTTGRATHRACLADSSCPDIPAKP